MSDRVGFKNIQIQSKKPLADLFEDTYQQSGANSKGEFLHILLNDYLNPDVTFSQKAADAETQLSAVSEEKSELLEENEKLKNLLKHYENDILLKVFVKHKGEKLNFRNPAGKKVQIEINEPKDAYTAIINSIEV